MAVKGTVRSVLSLEVTGQQQVYGWESTSAKVPIGLTQEKGLDMRYHVYCP